MTAIDLASVRTELDACPLTDRAREAVDGLLAEVEHSRAEVRAWAVPLVVCALRHHDFNSDACVPTPVVDCWAWCNSCSMLAAVPADVQDAARVLIREYETTDSIEAPF